MYLATPSDHLLTEVYSVVALMKGLDRSHSVLILAGTTTIGTQAAVEYVCQQSFLEQLLLRLSVSNSGEVKPFEAVIHVKVAIRCTSRIGVDRAAKEPTMTILRRRFNLRDSLHTQSAEQLNAIPFVNFTALDHVAAIYPAAGIDKYYVAL